jgi:hypothetical protein
MQEINQQFVEKILDRIKLIINAVTDSDIAVLFDVKPATISAWRVRNSIDFNKLSSICKEQGWSLDEIVLGMNTNCKSESTIQESENPVGGFDLTSYILSRDRKMDELNREIGRLQEQNRILKKYEPHNIAFDVNEP